MNWAGEPLVSYETVVQLIGSTTTGKGLKIEARLDSKAYATQVKIDDEQMKSVRLKPHARYPQWNYTIAGSMDET
jgi:hypothetical protein